VKVWRVVCDWIERSTGSLTLLFSFSLTIATVLLAIVTALLWSTTRDLANEARKSSQGNLLVAINRDLFLTDRLYKVRKAIESDGPLLREKGGKVDTQDVDDYIGFFDLLQLLVRQDILARDLVEESFCEFAIDAHQSKGIKEYIAELRKQARWSNVFTAFQEFAEKCPSKAEEVRPEATR
jgi:hypothetical protein